MDVFATFNDMLSQVAAAGAEDRKSVGADTMLIDDHRIFHGVTAIHPVDPDQPAWRDALVVTFASAG